MFRLSGAISLEGQRPTSSSFLVPVFTFDGPNRCYVQELDEQRRIAGFYEYQSGLYEVLPDQIPHLECDVGQEGVIAIFRPGLGVSFYRADDAARELGQIDTEEGSPSFQLDLAEFTGEAARASAAITMFALQFNSRYVGREWSAIERRARRSVFEPATPPQPLQRERHSSPTVRPERVIDLIRMPEGGHEFRRGDWWSMLQDARVFLPARFDQVMLALGLNSIAPLVPLAPQAVAEVAGKTSWGSQLPAQRHWRDLASPQLRAAAAGSPMLLTKLVLALETLQLYADSQGAAVDVYARVDIVPGVYRAANWTPVAYAEAKRMLTPAYRRFLGEAHRLGQEQPDRVLHDLANGLHGTYPVVQLVSDCFQDVMIDVAHRRPRAGVAPTSQWIRAE